MGSKQQQEIQEVIASIDEEDLKAKREAKLILCEKCQGFFNRSSISRKAVWGEGIWRDGHWGAISVCNHCQSKLDEEFKGNIFG
ncbi:MAG: hypothetical protein ACXVB6_12290 [Mucilaginibacter sp.]